MKNLANIIIRWIGGGNSFIPIKYLKEIIIPGSFPSTPSFQQIQSDWNQDDNSKPDYIKNKPNISGGNFEVIITDKFPGEGNYTQAELDEYGFTADVFNKMANGKILGVVHNFANGTKFYSIIEAATTRFGNDIVIREYAYEYYINKISENNIVITKTTIHA